MQSKTVVPGDRFFLYDLSRASVDATPRVLAGAARVYDETVGTRCYSFTCKSPAGTDNVMRILLPSQPEEINAEAADGLDYAWDEKSKTLLLTFANDPDGVDVVVKW